MTSPPCQCVSRKQLQNGQHISVETVAVSRLLSSSPCGFPCWWVCLSSGIWSPMKLSLLEVLSGRFLKISKVENCMVKLWIVCFVFCGGSVIENVLGWKGFWVMSGSCDVCLSSLQVVTRKEVPFRIAQHFCYVWGWLSTHLLRSFWSGMVLISPETPSLVT